MQKNIIRGRGRDRYHSIATVGQLTLIIKNI